VAIGVGVGVDEDSTTGTGSAIGNYVLGLFGTSILYIKSRRQTTESFGFHKYFISSLVRHPATAPLLLPLAHSVGVRVKLTSEVPVRYRKFNFPTLPLIGLLPPTPLVKSWHHGTVSVLLP
jgi:hypothetical protein